MEDHALPLLENEGDISNGSFDEPSPANANARLEEGGKRRGHSPEGSRDFSRADTELDNHMVEEAAPGGSSARRAVAVCFIALAIAIWVTEMEVTHDLVGSGPGQYNNPYALVWVAHNISMVIGFTFGGLLACFAKAPRGAESACDMLFRPRRKMLWSTLLLSVVVNLQVWTWFISLPITDTMVNTVIYQSCCVWVFLISVIFLKERVTFIKVSSTLLTFIGVATISSFPCVSGPVTPPGPPTSEETQHLLGDVFVIVSAILYAVYEVLFKLFFEPAPAASSEEESRDEAEQSEVEESEEEERFRRNMATGELRRDGSSGGDVVPRVDAHSTPQGSGTHLAATSFVFVGWLGFWNFILLWIPIVALHYSGFTVFEIPEESLRPMLLLDCALQGTYTASLAVAICFSSPLFVTIGTVLAIPASVMVDALCNGISCSAASGVGTGLVVTGFLGINIAALLEGRRDVPSWL